MGGRVSNSPLPYREHSWLHLRYDLLKSAPEAKKDPEIKILECTEKSHIPEYLQYRDRGHVYFPKRCFIPFIRAVDKCVCNFANEESGKQ